MKFLSWMKNKIHGNDNTIKPEPQSPAAPYHMHQPCKEEIGGCSSTLLSIGTFGNNLEDSDNANTEETPLSAEEDHLQSMAAQEFEKELRIFLNEHSSNSSGESERFDLPMEKMWESLPAHEEQEEEAEEEHLVGLEIQRRNSSSAGKDIPAASCSRKSSIYKKSITFLLKKAFVCRGGFAPPPILKHPFPNTNLDPSTMEKILKTVLRKKKHPERQKYLEKSPRSVVDDEEQGEATNNANHWVKTDSEYIFLDL